MSARCEPREELRDVDGWHWLAHPKGALLPEMWRASRGMWEWFGVEGESAPDGWRAKEGYRYLAPVATPAEVAALRAEVERVRGALSPLVAVIPVICNALDLDPDETLIRVRVDGGARDGEVLAERTLADMLTVARAALTHKEPGDEG